MIKSLKKYIEAIENGDFPLLNTHVVTKQESIEEEMFLGLRKIDGVSKQHFIEKFDLPMEQLFSNHIEELVKEALVENTEDALKLSYKGRFVGNEVFQQFLLDS